MNDNSDIRQEIIDAVFALGYHEPWSIEVTEISMDRYCVSVNDGEMIGIYDTVKHTFVD